LVVELCAEVTSVDVRRRTTRVVVGAENAPGEFVELVNSYSVRTRFLASSNSSPERTPCSRSSLNLASWSAIPAVALAGEGVVLTGALTGF
jgi:hypothetical protein